MKKAKFLKWNKTSLLLVGVLCLSPFFIFLANCGNSYVPSNILIYANTSDPFLHTSTPMNPTFTDGTSAGQFFSSTQASLISWKTSGIYAFDNDNKITESPESTLTFEAAIAFKIYDETNKITYEQNAKTNKIIELPAIALALSTARKIEFTLNKDLKWVDTQGNVKQPLVPRDFLYGLISYSNSAKYGLNPNSYFLDLSGIDYKATIDDLNNKSDTPGQNFTYYVNTNEQTPFLFDILTKQYFHPVPYSNSEVVPTVEIDPSNPNPNSPIKFTSKETIDKALTDWNKIFNSGSGQQTNPDGWFVGPYYVSGSTLQDIKYNINPYFFEATSSVDVGGPIFGLTNEKIPQVVLNYGNSYGTFEKMFRSYITNDLNYVKVNSEQIVESYSRYRNTNEFHQTGVSKNNKTSLVSYNSQIYSSSTGELKSNIGTVYEKFVNNWSTDGLIIRKAINGVINYPKLAEIVWNIGNYDLTMSVLPYGNEDVGLVSQYQSIVDGVSNGAFGNKFETMVKGESLILNDPVSQKLIQDMHVALDRIGATKNNPLIFNYYTLITNFSTTQTKYNEVLKNTIETITQNKISFIVTPRSPQTVQAVYYEANAPISNLLWSADYSQASTFLSLYFEVKANSDKTPLLVPNSIDGDLGKLVGLYHVPSLWAPLYSELSKATTDWQFELRNFLDSKGIFKNGSGFAPNNWTSTTKYSDIDATKLATQIGVWTSLKNENVIHLTNWIDSQYTQIPYVQEGLYFRGVELWKPQFDIVHSINGEENYKNYNLKK